MREGCVEVVMKILEMYPEDTEICYYVLKSLHCLLRSGISAVTIFFLSFKTFFFFLLSWLYYCYFVS